MVEPPEPSNLQVFLTILGTLATGIAAVMSRRMKRGMNESTRTSTLREQLLQAKLDALKSEIMRDVEKLGGRFQQLEVVVKSHMANSDRLLLQQGEKFLAALKGIQAMHKRGDDRLQKMEELYKEVHHFCERIHDKD